MKYLLTTILLLGTGMLVSAQKQFVVNNAQPRYDTEGNIIDAHDGRIIKFGGTYYWYGTRYGNTSGFTPANDYVCYSSKDLRSWRREGFILPEKPNGIYYRPHVIYNKKTSMYVLWYNWYPSLWSGRFGVAISENPVGPFRILNDSVPVRHSKLGVGDLGLFVDDDGIGYISYNTINGHKVSIERLDDTYTGTSMEGSEFIVSHSEAGALFKRNGLYYLLTDYTCCFCTQGSGAQVYTSRHPLGPYQYRQNINRYPGSLVPILYDGDEKDNQYETLLGREKQYLELHLKEELPLYAIEMLQFTGDREGQCGNQIDEPTHLPIVSTDYQIDFFSEGEWFGMPTMRKTSSSAAMILSTRLSFDTIRTTKIRIYPKYNDSTSRLHLSEVILNNTRVNMRIYKCTGRMGKPIIPAQQAFVMALDGKERMEYSWIGDLWGSASDNVKGHDYQFWSAPLKFYPNGLIEEIIWVDEWTLEMK